MSLQTRLESLVLRLAAEFKTIYGQVGTLANLSTTDKTSLVSSINELRSQISTLAGLTIIDDANAAGTATTFSASKITTLLDALKADLLGGADAAFDTSKSFKRPFWMTRRASRPCLALLTSACALMRFRL